MRPFDTEFGAYFKPLVRNAMMRDVIKMSWALGPGRHHKFERQGEHKEITRAAKQTRTAAGQEVTLHFFF